MQQWETDMGTSLELLTNARVIDYKAENVTLTYASVVNAEIWKNF